MLLVAPMLAESAANAAKPGEEIDLKNYLRRGVTNIVDFYSEYCPPCRQISPRLIKLDQKRNDIKVVKIDINRKDVRGIDWGSPLVKQFQLQSIPHFKIYDEMGNLKAEGEEAYYEVMGLLKKEGI